MAKFAKIANIDSAGGLRPLGQIQYNGESPSKKTARPTAD
jgi:hypothetical protein